MKKKVVVGICGVTAMLLGAVTVTQVIEAQSTVSSWGELVEKYYTAREQLPPLPFSVEDTIHKIEKDDWSFLADGWQVQQEGGVWYVKEGSELSKLKLPIHVMILEDLRLGDVIVMSGDGTNFQGEAIFDAPEMVEEASSFFKSGEARAITPAKASTFTKEEQLDALFWDLSARRVVWSVVLKPASALAELFARSTSAPTEGGGGMMRPSAPPAYTNDIWLHLETLTNGDMELEVFASDQYTNIEVFSIGTLLSNQWSLTATNLNPAGPTNPATVTVGGPEVQFYRACTWADTDEDGLSSGIEMYVSQTDPLDADTDGDGYSDGSVWPAGYSNVMRGVNDAFPNDASAWRDTDGDGLPNEVVGTSTSEPQLVEDLDDDGDGTNEMSMAGIWISAAEISGLATNGAQWENLVEEASQAPFDIDISDQDDWANVVTMAKGLVYARTDIESYRTQVIDACSDAIGTEAGANTESLAVGRNLAAFVIAADLVDLPQAADMEFRDWLREMLTKVMPGDGRSITTCHEQRPNNWGTMAGGSRAAVAAYLQDWDELDRAAKVFKGYLGDTNSHNGFIYGTNLTWQADTNNPVGINPKNATINGHSVDGVLPDDQRRSGDFEWPPPRENYVYEALQGAVLQAVVLERAGYDVWSWEDQALLRAFKWLNEDAQYTAIKTVDEKWVPFVVNQQASTNLVTPVTSRYGKNMASTCWTHPVVDTDEDGLPDWWESEHFSGPTNAVATADPDGDSVSNLEEYLNSTDPVTNIDTDSDGMSDDWERWYWLDPNDPSDELVDSDGDRIPNLYEYIHGQTDPSDPASLPEPTVTVTTNYTGGISTAVAYATTNDTIGYPIVLIETGTYTNAGDRGVTLTNENILIYGTNATAVLDGGSSDRFFRIPSGRVVLAGLIMQNGYATTYGGDGGAVTLSDTGKLHIRNCVFLDNRAVDNGGAVFGAGGDMEIESSTFLGNQADDFGGAIGAYYRPMIIRNCLVWSNTASSFPQIWGPGYTGMKAEVSFSCVAGGYPGAGNTTNDPYLVTNDWRIASTNSSCWNAGNPTNAMASDIDGGLRGAAVDMGADEYSE